MPKTGRFIAVVLLLVPAALVSTLTVSAQERFGSFLGTVTDPTGAVLPDVTVTLINKENNRGLTTKTDGSGAYVFRQVEPGHYRFNFERSGFANYKVEDALLQVGREIKVDAA